MDSLSPNTGLLRRLYRVAVLAAPLLGASPGLTGEMPPPGDTASEPSDTATPPVAGPAATPSRQTPAATIEPSESQTARADRESSDSEEWVPPGFEALSEPQTNVVDVYLGDELLISQMATFTGEEIRFTNPQAIAEAIPLLLDSEPVVDALSGDIPAQPERICRYQGQPACGQLDPESAAVIFDQDNFRADLFVNSELLSVRGLERRKYLPASDARWSLLQGLSAAYAGADGRQNENYNLRSRSLFAFRENRFQLNSSYSRDGNGQRRGFIDTAALRRDWRGREYQLGYFRGNSGGFQFMSDAPVRGMRMASSLDTREDLRQTTGNELEVFLPSRSEVAIYKDGRLVSSRFYDAGNQLLDTSELPGGAYEVTLEIRDEGGAVREETRFYVKSSRLPPNDQPLYFLEAGELLDPQDREGLAEGQGLALLRAGYRTRVNDGLGLLAGFTTVDNQRALELGLDHLGRYHELSLGMFLGDGERHGARIGLRGRYQRFYWNANYRRLWNEASDPSGPAYLFGRPSTQASVNLSTFLPAGRLQLSGRYNRRGDEARENYGVHYRLPRFSLGPGEILMGLEWNRANGRGTGLFTFEFRRNGDHLTTRVSPEYRRDPGTDAGHWQTTGVLSWRDREILPDSDLRLDLRGRERPDEHSSGVEMDGATDNGRLRLQAERVKTPQSRRTRYNGNAHTSFLLNGDNAKLGSRDQAQSALLVEVDGELDDAVFDILVDDNPRARVDPDQITALNLRPYESYRVRLRQRGSSFAEFDEQPREVTLYPGNVVNLRWEVSELDVVFGRMLDSDGDPIADAVIHGVSGLATTDEFGLFQAELPRRADSLTVETRRQECEVSVPEYQVERGIAKLGTLSCTLQDK